MSTFDEATFEATSGTSVFTIRETVFHEVEAANLAEALTIWMESAEGDLQTGRVLSFRGKGETWKAPFETAKERYEEIQAGKFEPLAPSGADE